MKILQLANKPPWPARDGGAIAMLSLTKGLANAGNEVTVLAMNTTKHHTNPDEIPAEIRKLADFRWVEVPAETSPLQAVFNLLFSKQPYNAVRFISKTYETALARTLEEKKFDIVQLEGLYLCPYVPVIRKHSSAVVAYRSHNIENEIWSRTASISRGAKRWYLKNLASRIEKFEKQWLNSYDLLVPITERDEKILENMGNRKPSHVSPTGIDMGETGIETPRGRAGEESDSVKGFSVLISDPAAEAAGNALTGTQNPNLEYPSLFHIGSLDWAPNQEGLLWFLKNCWPEISANHPDLRFCIAGRNAPGWLISRLSAPGIDFLGEVENAYALMASKAVMIVPLLSGSGMRIKIIEGMALGKAIVTTSTGAEGIPVTHLRNILIADTPGDFIRNVEMVIREKTQFELIGKNARQFISDNFDSRVMAHKLAQFYINNLP